MIKVSCVVTLFYPDEEVFKNIKTYYSDIDRLFVIDNTPEKGNEHHFPDTEKVKYIAYGKNIGVSKALNIGAKESIKEGYHWLLTMDQDSAFKPGDAAKLKTIIEERDMSNIGIVTPWHKTKLPEKKPKEKTDFPPDVMTSGNFINLDIYQKIGGFKNWLFIDGIDIDYCINLRQSGYKIMRINNIEIEHDLGDIINRKLFGKKIICTNHNAFRRYFIMRNYHYLYDIYKEYDPFYCKMLIAQNEKLLHILLFEKDKFNKLRNSWRGYRDYKKGINGGYPY